jgi:DNA-binding HxlR family transcriptional regulator
MARGIHRHSDLFRCLPGVSKKVMTGCLRALERDGLVGRRVYAEVPVRVEYSLTSLGWTITEPLMALSEWGQDHRTEVEEAHTRRAPGQATTRRERSKHVADSSGTPNETVP